MVDHVKVRAELDADPLGRGYAGMSNEEASDSFMLKNRPGAADRGEVDRAVLLGRHRSNNGTDLAPTNIYGRLKSVSNAAVGVDVFGQGPVGADAELTVAEDIHSACTFLRMIEIDIVPLEMRGTDIGSILGDLVRAEIMSGGDRNALRALSDNKQSRGQEIGSGDPLPGDILAARNLP